MTAKEYIREYYHKHMPVEHVLAGQTIEQKIIFFEEWCEYQGPKMEVFNDILISILKDLNVSIASFKASNAALVSPVEIVKLTLI